MHMNKYIKDNINVCLNEPIWAVVFVICGFVIGDTYFNL